MPQFTIFTGIALVLVGVVGYFATGMVSVTALIPSFFGVVMAGLGTMAKNPARLKLAMHLAALLGVLGLAGSAKGVPAVFQMLSGIEVALPAAQIARTAMFIICLVFVIACVRSFIAARKARQTA